MSHCLMLSRIVTYYSILAVLFFFFLAQPAFSQTLRIGYVEFPPMTYTDKNGQPAGFILDITTKTLEKAGFQWTAVSLPAKRLANSLAEGSIQVWLGLTTMPQFEGTTHVGKTVVEQLSLRAYTIGKSPPIRKREDLQGNTILILRGYSYGGWVSYIKDPDNRIKYLEFDSRETAFMRLEKLSKRIPNSYLLDYKHPSEIILKKQSIPYLQFNKVSALDMHFVVTRKMKESKKVLEQIETAFRQLSADGAL